MGKWRQEIKILPCGCKVGRSASSVWFYDFICEKHLEEVYVNGKYSYEKATEMTDRLNRDMKNEA